MQIEHHKPNWVGSQEEAGDVSLTHSAVECQSVQHKNVKKRNGCIERSECGLYIWIIWIQISGNQNQFLTSFFVNNCEAWSGFGPPSPPPPERCSSHSSIRALGKEEYWPWHWGHENLQNQKQTCQSWELQSPNRFFEGHNGNRSMEQTQWQILSKLHAMLNPSAIALRRPKPQKIFDGIDLGIEATKICSIKNKHANRGNYSLITGSLKVTMTAELSNKHKDSSFLSCTLCWILQPLL